MGHIYVVGTADTKGEELACLAGRIRAAGVQLRARATRRAPSLGMSSTLQMTFQSLITALPRQ